LRQLVYRVCPVDIPNLAGDNQFAAQTGLQEEPAMNPEDLDRILFITRRFQQLQGLRWMVPVGLVTLSVGLGSAFLPSYPALLLAVLAGAIFLSLRSRAYYLERFGKVEPRHLPMREQIVIGAAVLAVYGLEPLTKRGLYPLELILYAGLAMLFLVPGFGVLGEAQRDQTHYLLLGALFLLLALPSRAVQALFPWRARTGVDFMLCGTALILAGLLDHRFLVRNLEGLGASLSAGTPQEIES
jgi:hypothetical protein